MVWKRAISLNSFMCVYETVELESWGTVRERERDCGVRKLGDRQG